ncbi:hypothetical protein P3T27_006172 [Kitasatospora sp. MAA19]|uniref:hypothetical protein n=1 Tax=Kitasatospora sp. MAA19 TaxID=3035090 RepID=UPI0024762E59|nr:hypothetical protein [Kitasatospora sp. MAA19]MDH6709426.1 hypothetical protein [Kitasatospora sp. MAA19]
MVSFWRNETLRRFCDCVGIAQHQVGDQRAAVRDGVLGLGGERLQVTDPGAGEETGGGNDVQCVLGVRRARTVALGAQRGRRDDEVGGGQLVADLGDLRAVDGVRPSGAGTGEPAKGSGTVGPRL